MKLTIILTLSLLMSVFGACQWTLTDSDLAASSNTRLVSQFDVEEDGYYEWEESVWNWFWVTGTPPPLDPNPAWSNYFANLADNEWEDASEWAMELEDGDRVKHFEDYTIRWGHEVFTRPSGSPTTASRFLRYYGTWQHETEHNLECTQPTLGGLWLSQSAAAEVEAQANMTLRPLLPIVLMCLTCLAKAQTESVIDVLIATNDKKLVAAIEKNKRQGATPAAYRKQLDEKRFRVAEWGKSGLILLDRELPMLQQIVEERELYSAMLKHADSKGILDLSKMPAADREAVDRRVRARLGPITGNYKVSAGQTTELTLTNPSGKTQTVSLFGDIEQRRKVHAELEASAPKRDPEARAQSSDGVPSTTNSALVRGEFGVHLLSYFTGRMPDGLQHLSKIVEDEMVELRKRRDEVLLSLMRGLKEMRGGLAAPVPFNQLPEDLKKSAREQLVAGFRAYGFSSPDEARTYLESVEVKVETKLTMTVFAAVRGRGFLMEVIGRLPGG